LPTYHHGVGHGVSRITAPGKQAAARNAEARAWWPGSCPRGAAEYHRKVTDS
jgi:hypothetical protein